MVRRTLAEPKTALVGVMLEISFARLRAKIAASNFGRMLSRSLEGLGVGAIIGTRGS